MYFYKLQLHKHRILNLFIFTFYLTTERERDQSSISWFILQMLATSKARS